MGAVIIANWKYCAGGYDDLVDPHKDGEMMKKLLEEGGYQNIEQFHNEEDIESIVKTVIEKQEAPLDRFHFHYSGFRIFKIK